MKRSLCTLFHVIHKKPHNVDTTIVPNSPEKKSVERAQQLSKVRYMTLDLDF